MTDYNLLRSNTKRIARKEYKISTLEICKRLDLDHGNTRELIDRYSEEFQEFGSLVPFETEASKPQHRKKFYELNYYQFSFLLTLVRNTEKTIPAKIELIKRYRNVTEELEYERTKVLTAIHNEEIRRTRAELAALYSEAGF